MSPNAMPPNLIDDPFVSPKIAAAAVGVSRMTIHRLVSSGRLRAYKLGSQVVRIRMSDLLALFEPTTPTTLTHASAGVESGGEE